LATQRHSPQQTRISTHGKQAVFPGPLGHHLCMGSLPTPEEIAEAESVLLVRFPDDYRTFLLRENGRDWDTGADNVRLYSLSQLVRVFETSEEYQRQRHPGLLYIGDDGSSEGLAYDTRPSNPPLVLVNYASPGWSSGLYQAPNFGAFLDNFASRGWDFETPYSINRP